MRCWLVVGGDFSVHFPISHRSWLSPLIADCLPLSLEMCFYAAVIIILATQAQANPLSCSTRERERKRQNPPLTARMSVFQQQCHVKWKRKRGGMMCLEHL